MAKYRPHIGKKVKKRLIKEAGNKCANPGCPNIRIAIHHIKEWAIYQTHDEKHMIAVCQSCHDAIHNGNLKIDDETLYRWKGLKRNTEVSNTHLYVEASNEMKLMCGSICFKAPLRTRILRISPKNALGFKIVNDEHIVLDLIITDLNKNEVIKVVENYIKYKYNDSVEYKQRAGKVNVTAPLNSSFITDIICQKVKTIEPSFGEGGVITLLDIEVIKPGLIKIEGIWLENDIGYVITKNALIVIPPNLPKPLAFEGCGEQTVIESTFDVGFGSIFETA